MRRQLEELGHALHPDQAQHESEDRGDGHDPGNRIDQIRPGGEQPRTGLEPPDHQRADEHGHDGVAGHAQRQRRRHGGAQRGVRCGIACREALQGSLAELLRMLGRPTSGRPGGDARDVPACGRHSTDDGADARPDRHRLHDLTPLLTIRHPAAEVLDRLHPLLLAGQHLVQHIGDAEEPDDHRDEGQAVGELEHPEGHPLGPEDRVPAHSGEGQPEGSCGKALEDIVARDPDHHRQPEDDQREDLRRAEAQGDVRQRDRREDEHQQPGQRPDGRAEGGGRQRDAGLALLGHRIAVERGGDRGRRPGGVDQDGRHAVTEVRRDVDGQQHRQPGHRIHRQGEGTGQGHCHRSGDAREGADEDTGERTDEDAQQDSGVGELREPFEHRTHTGTLSNTPNRPHRTSMTISGNSSSDFQPLPPPTATRPATSRNVTRRKSKNCQRRP